MKNFIKKALSILLVTVMVFGVAPLTGFVGLELPEFGAFQKFANSVSSFFEGFTTKAAAATKYIEGYYTYSVDSNGNAKITDFDSSISGDIIIPSTLGGYSVTSIGEGAFPWCKGPTSITIPESITSIGERVFGNCYGLTSIIVDENNANYSSDECGVLFNKDKTELIFYPGGNARTNYIIPDSVTSIGEDAFYSCDGLTSITIPESVTSIGDYAFGFCTRLTSIVVADNNANYSSDEYGVLFNKDKTELILFPIDNPQTNYIIPDSVISICDYAFEWSLNLTSIEIPDSVKRIGSDAFSNNRCVNWENHVGYVGKHLVAVEENNITGSYIIKEGTLTIAENAFYSCDGLTSITIPESVTSIGERAFYFCKGLTSITIPERVTNIGENAFSYCTGLTTINFDAINCETLKSVTPFYNCKAVTTLNIGDKVTYIPALFSGLDNLTSITIPDSVTSIGDYVFSSCTGLTSVNFGENSQLTSIGHSAFSDCTGLTSITIPESVTSIGERAFSWCKGLTSVNFGENSQLTSIGYSAFSDCTGLTSITIPESVTSIGSMAFYYCTGLTSVNFGENSQLTSIGERAFERCSKLTSITIPERVTNIGESAFGGCVSITSVNFNSVYCEKVSGSYNPFKGCTALTIVNIGDEVTHIPSYAFYNCTGLTSVNFGENSQLTSIGDYAFINCDGLTSITIPESVTYIGDDAFDNCSRLTSITIPESVTSIGERAFDYCKNIVSAFYPGTPEEWSKITIGSNNTYLTDNIIFESNSTKPYYGSGKCGENLTWKLYTDGQLEISGTGAMTAYGSFESAPWYNLRSRINSLRIADGVASVCSYIFSGYTELTSIVVDENNTNYSNDEYGVLFNKDKTELVYYPSGNTRTNYSIPDSVTSVGGSAFRGCTGLTSVNFGENSQLTSVGAGAFYNCSGLVSITIPESVTSIGGSAFNNCTGLTSITIPESVTSIGKYAFYGCAGLTSVNFGENSQLTSIDERAFYDCTGLTSITIPESVTSIGKYAFRGCTGLTSVNFNAINCSVISSAYPFSGCTAITTVNIGEKVTWIPAAFSDCTGLTSITFPESVTSIGGSAFENCTGLTSVNFAENSRLTSISSDAFYNCDGLTSVTIPEGVTRISDYAFYGCSGLTSITIPESVTSIGKYAFDYTAYYFDDNNWENNLLYIGKHFVSIKRDKINGSQIIKEGTLTIVESAFASCTGLTSVIIPGSVTNIGRDAFYNCTRLTDVYYAASEAKWKKITINDFNDPLLNATKHFNYCSANTSHIYTKTIVIKEATCLLSGISEYKCECGYGYTANTPALGHNYEESSRIEATCTAEGTIFYTCTYDSSHTKTETIEKTEHKPKDIKIEASCTVNGMESTICENCGAVLGAASFTPALGHNFVEVSREDATCTEDGTIYYECSRNSSHTKTETINKKGHSLGKWATEKEPACTKKGIQRRYCENCDYYEEQESSALGHNFVETSRKDATCTEDGTIYYECSRNSSHTKTETIDKKGHSLGEWITDTEPTCIEEGSRHKDCANCDYSEEEILDATGHSWDDKHTVDKDATCTEEGSKSIHCIKCDEKTSVTVVPSLGHNFVEVSREDAACTEDGIINYECSRDGSHTKTETIEKKGHSLGEWITDTEPTCTEEGSRHKNCKNCDYSEEEILDATGHSWNDKHIIDKPATCTEEGSKSIHCTKCGEKTSVTVIPALGHNYKETSRTDATCTKDGTIYHECSRNSSHKKTEVIPAKGHTSGEWTTETEPTISTEGKKIIRCVVCQEILEAEVIPMLKSDTVVDDDTGISMDYAEENYEGEVKINVEEEFEGVAFQIMDTKLGPTDGRIFDITMTVDGVEAQPNGKVVIKIPLPEGFNYNNSFVYYINIETGTFDIVPSRYENGYIIFETDHFSYYAIVDTTALTVNIRKPSVTTISYGDAIILHADVNGKLPAGAKIKWEASNGNFAMEVSADGTTCKISPSSKGDTTFTVSAVDAKGKVISSDEQTMNSKAGFFDKIIAFFKKLFGLTKTIPQVYKGIF